MFKKINAAKKKYSFWKHIALESTRSRLLGKNGAVALKDVLTFLSSCGITHWVDAGTLLGIVRDGCFIEGDTDIDIGILFNTDGKEFIAALEEAGFTIRYSYHYSNGDLALLRIEKHFVGIDIECFRRDESVYYYDAPREYVGLEPPPTPFVHSALRYVYEATCLDNLEKRFFQNICFPAPSNLDLYFSTYYKNWKQKIGKRNYLDGYFGVHVDLYQHHNDKASYNPDDVLFFHTYSSSTITVTLFEVILSVVKAKVGKI
ncbi:LicD family protein [Halodesulfovibrio sp.]|uniref:LicD family protein n=1 Tax=Halodesulfovibrio sp. TaxID=1912772 RepID=UPI0025C6F788|nr:LicD family protein [Halodesulfovibrio sp.]